MKRRKVIVFDLDDTLYKEIDFLKSAFRFIAQNIEHQHNLSGIFDFMMTCRSDNKNVYEEINQHFSLNISKEIFLQQYRNHFPDIQLDKETAETLQILANAGNSVLGIITDGRKITQTNKIKALGLEKWFSNGNIIISETFGSEKPAERNYLYFQQKYPDATFYYIGDNTEKDFIAPNNLGWETVCLLGNGQNIHKQNFDLSEEFLPKYKMEKLKELLAWLEAVFVLS
jgi:putative hydrolase of the HAD superfamily